MNSSNAAKSTLRRSNLFTRTVLFQFLHEESFAKAFLNFHSAISADPNYAHAYAGIADYYNWLGILGVLPPQECFLPAMRPQEEQSSWRKSFGAPASLAFSLRACKYEWSRAAHL